MAKLEQLSFKLYELTDKLIQSALISGCFLLLSHAASSASACQLPTTLSHSVIGITDSRTLHLDDGTQLRLASILTPTPYDIPAADPSNVWPPAVAAQAFITAQSLHHSIGISLERTGRDRYDRRVGHALVVAEQLGKTIDVPAPQWLQAKIVQAGHARVALTPETDASCARDLFALEAEAEAAGRGLWQQAAYQPKRAEDIDQLLRYRSTYQIVEGVVHRVAILKSAVYLNFGPDWQRDFSAKLSPTVLKQTKTPLAKTSLDWLRKLRHAPIRIRGWIEKRNGPMITVWRLEQIERLSLTPAGKTQRSVPPHLLDQPPSETRYR